MKRPDVGSDDLDEEIRSHLHLAIEERVARGESREHAEQEVRREFGNVGQIKEVTHDLRSGLWFERLRQDVRYGARGLLRTPAFTGIAVLTLALAIGANSAVFTVVNNVLLRPLPFRDPSRLYLPSYIPSGLSFNLPAALSDRLYVNYKQQAHVFSELTAYRRVAVTLSGEGDAVRLFGSRVTADFFHVLGISPVLGRGFTADEEVRDHDRVVVLSDHLWRQRFGASPQVVGRTLTIDGVPHTVVGVAPPRFTFPSSAELWLPLVISLNGDLSYYFPVVGRLRDGATPEQARSELAAIAKGMPSDLRDTPERPVTAAIVPLRDTLTGPVEKSLLLFSGAVAFVLLIACVNVANLQLIRASTRRHELALRVALGASRARLAVQLLIESTLLAGAGGLAGVFVAYAGVQALLALAPQGRIPRLDEVHMDAQVLAFTLAMSLVTGILFGTVPALIGSRRDPRESMAQGVRTVVGAQSRLRGLLVSAEIALALVLLTGAGLMIKSFVRMRTLDTGYRAEHVMSMAVDLPAAAYSDAPHVRQFHDRLLDELAHISGVRAAGAASWRPMGNMGVTGDFLAAGDSPTPHGFSVDRPTVSPGYFGAMGIRVLRGRDFSARDNLAAPGVAIISESVARRVWPGQEAVGQRISMEDKHGAGDWLTVVGVVNDIVQDVALRKHSTIYLPYQQVKPLFLINHMTFVVRADAPAGSVLSAMRRALHTVDPTVPAQALESMDDSMLATIAEPLFQTRLVTVFSVLALLLAVVGTYGVLAYDVAERTREISLRMALGATPGSVMRMILARTARLAVAGAAAGTIAALGVTNVLTKSLFQVKPNDPWTFAIMLGFIVASALAAGYLPARRATRVDVLSAFSRS